MTPSKRLMDLGLALLLLIVLAVPILIVALWVLVSDGRPVLYPSERMKTPDTPFTLWKFRSMRTDHNDTGVSGGYKTARITRTGRILRGKRLDELPQLFNILKGDMSFVGPRPPLRRYVELRPDLYARVLRNRPGVTGLATLRYHAHEEKLLARCTDAAETERVYLTHCVPAKARFDLIWAHNRSFCFDAALIVETVRRVLLRKRRK
ncbi:MAG: sugar transferase [Roseovarius sp.]